MPFHRHPPHSQRQTVRSFNELLGVVEGGVDAGYEGGGVELGADDFVGAVGEGGYAPVADEGYELAVVAGLDFSAETLGEGDALFAFNVYHDEIEGAAVEDGESFGEVAGGGDLVAGDPEDLVAEGSQNFTLTEMEDRFLRGGFSRHGALWG